MFWLKNHNFRPTRQVFSRTDSGLGINNKYVHILLSFRRKWRKEFLTLTRLSLRCLERICYLILQSSLLFYFTRFLPYESLYIWLRVLKRTVAETYHVL